MVKCMKLQDPPHAIPTTVAGEFFYYSGSLIIAVALLALAAVDSIGAEAPIAGGTSPRIEEAITADWIQAREKEIESDADIDAAMMGNLCRCATYARIRKAIKAATEELA